MIDEIAPIKEVRVKSNSQDWFDAEINEEIERQDKLSIIHPHFTINMPCALVFIPRSTSTPSAHALAKQEKPRG